jgi:hypothetical protein
MIIKVGKAKRREANRELDYVIMTDPTANKLFVLARDMDHFMDNDMDDVCCHIGYYPTAPRL